MRVLSFLGSLERSVLVESGETNTGEPSRKIGRAWMFHMAEGERCGRW